MTNITHWIKILHTHFLLWTYEYYDNWLFLGLVCKKTFPSFLEHGKGWIPNPSCGWSGETQGLGVCRWPQSRAEPAARMLYTGLAQKLFLLLKANVPFLSKSKLADFQYCFKDLNAKHILVASLSYFSLFLNLCDLSPKIFPTYLLYWIAKQAEVSFFLSAISKIVNSLLLAKLCSCWFIRGRNAA